MCDCRVSIGDYSSSIDILVDRDVGSNINCVLCRSSCVYINHGIAYGILGY